MPIEDRIIIKSIEDFNEKKTNIFLCPNCGEELRTILFNETIGSTLIRDYSNFRYVRDYTENEPLGVELICPFCDWHFDVRTLESKGFSVE